MREFPAEPDSGWLTSLGRVNGVTLALRVRLAAGSPANRQAYPNVALIRHELTKVSGNGLPDADYNDSLAGFDAQMLAIFDDGDANGLFVLVETLGGRRNYYAYVADTARLEAQLKALRERYPGQMFILRCGRDADWQLYDEYRRQFPM